MIGVSRIRRFFSGSKAKAPARAGGPPPSRRGEIEIEGGRGTYTALGYHSATTATREGRYPVTGSGDMHLSYHREQRVAQAREFARDNGIFKGMIERAVSYVLGDGFKLQAKSADPEWNRDAEALWSDWWKSPEARGVLTGPRLERMVARELFSVGESIGLMLSSGLVQIVEAEQMASSQYPDGIQKSTEGAPLSYWIAPYSDSGQVNKAAAKPKNPAFVLHLLDPERPSAHRAVPPCQSTFSMLHRINDVCDSEAAAFQLLARLAVSITRQNGPQIGRSESKQDPAKSSDKEGDLATRISELDYALIFNGNLGDEVRGIEHNIPGQNFPDAVTMFLRLLGLPLGLPLEIILLDWTKSNFSQSRAVLEQAFQTFKGWQSLIVGGWHSRLYGWKVGQFMAEGSLALRDDSLAHDWIAPQFPWLDQLAEARASAEKVERGYATHAEICKQLGREREDIVKIRDEEIRDAIEKAQKILADTGTAVPWQLFAGVPLPGNGSAVAAEASLGKPAPAPAGVQP